jgi:hypothetical protein
MTVELADSSVCIKRQLDRLEGLAAGETELLHALVGRDSAGIASLQRKLEALYDSTSWRITAPLQQWKLFGARGN